MGRNNFNETINISENAVKYEDDLKEIISLSEKLNCKIITTEKDFLRLEQENINEIKFIKTKLKIMDEKKLIKAILNLNEIH